MFGEGNQDLNHLVTGGCGFLGGLIARRLLDRGEAVTVLDIWKDPQLPSAIRFVTGDVCNAAAVAEAMRGIDIVHHNAALVPLDKAGREFFRVNVDGSRIVAEEAVKAGVQAFIHMSSSALFGNHPRGAISAETPPSPVEIYGQSKLEGEQAVTKACQGAGLPLIVIRPRTILGPGRLGIFKILFDWIREGRNVYTIGDGRIQFQFVHAEDLMDAYLLALNRGTAGVFNVGTDRFGTLREALEHLIVHAGTPSNVRALPESLAVGSLRLLDWLGLSPLTTWHYSSYQKEFYYDVSPLLNIGWKPRYSNDEMFRETYDWFLANQAVLRAEGQGGSNSSAAREKLLWLLKKIS